MPLHDSDLNELAMFPLPDMVLLPGSLLPLHIFEPRYRDMTRDILAGSRLIAMARLQDGHETDYFGRPPVHPTLGVGQVIASDQLPDGRYFLLVRGLIRARMVQEFPPDRSYRLIRVVQIMDRENGEPAVLEAAQHKLVSLCDELAESLEQGGEQLRELVRSASSPGQCADIVAATLITDVNERQRLLDTLDPFDRLRRVIKHVNEIVNELGGDSHHVLN